ncbi:hypothetical protein HGM15179_021094, partial [Zosterops borbonicus]
SSCCQAIRGLCATDLGGKCFISVGNFYAVKFCLRVIGARDTPKLTWKTSDPIWVDQWPMSLEKLHVLQELVQEQLQKGHIIPSNSPWNSPVFIIKKRSGGWRLLHDLRKINEAIEGMGPLQPGLPSPSMIPRNWHLIVIDLKDCFFDIPLHPDDAPRFSFSMPSINMQAPLDRYHWLVLPQGLRNSPSICQWYVAKILSPIREKMPDVLLYHYMDEILISAETVIPCQAVTAADLTIASEKVQKTSPWKYLGWKIN